MLSSPVSWTPITQECCDLPEAMDDREKLRERVGDIRVSGMVWWWWYKQTLVLERFLKLKTLTYTLQITVYKLILANYLIYCYDAMTNKRSSTGCFSNALIITWRHLQTFECFVPYNTWSLVSRSSKFNMLKYSSKHPSNSYWGLLLYDRMNNLSGFVSPLPLPDTARFQVQKSFVWFRAENRQRDRLLGPPI